MNRSWAGRWSFVLMFVLGTCGWGQAQTNSWNSNTGGNWDDASSWSLGVPPGSAQSIMFTNAFWKAVVIDSSTVSSAPQTLAVNALTITSVSPANGVYTTRNTLLLNYAGAGKPLVIGVDASNPGSLLVDSNSTVAMFSSGLIVNDALNGSNSPFGNFEVDGNFIQSDNSEVVAGFLDLNGSYNMTNGELFVGTQFIKGTFNQQGGTNNGAIVDSTNGVYNFFDGAINGAVTLSPGVFKQWGGTISPQLTFLGGTYYLLNGLLLPGDLNLGALSVADNFYTGGGSFVQFGGTNNPTSLSLGLGTYTLSNGVLNVTSMAIVTNTSVGGLFAGDFEQYGGYVTSGDLTMIGGTAEEFHGQEIISPAKYHLYRGTLQAPTINMNFGNITVAGVGSNATNLVGTLSMTSNSIYAIGVGGFLAADQIKITNGSQFWHQGGSLSGALNITLANGTWAESVPGIQLGQLHLMSGTNSKVSLPASGTLRFADSSLVPWPGGGTLTISGWSGAFNGGGSQQILFGTDASRLTSSQLSHVKFLNPAGLPNGIYGAQILSTGEVIPDQSSSSTGPLNSWINPASGNWDDAASWSLGVLPNSSQSVLIANTNWKAVAINPSTPINFPASMIVSNLFVDGATNTVNTLLLNNFGTNVSLTVINGLVVQNGGQLLDFNSGLIVQNGGVVITNSDLIQDGGFIRTTNVQMFVSGSEIDITNGVFEAGAVSLGYPVSSRYNQYGGSVTINSFILDSYVFGTNVNSVSLYGGTLNLPNGLSLYGEGGGISYFQSGGTNITGHVGVEVDYGGFDPSFTLNGGLLADSDVLLYSGYHAPLTITQNGGTHMITNTLSILGSSANGYSTDPANYYLNGGTLSAGTIELDADEGDSVFTQTNSTVFAGTVYTHSAGYFSGHNTYINLRGGTLSCLNYTNIDGNGQLNQTGGALVVSNLLNFGGTRNAGPTLYGRYTFAGGTLTANNINMSGDWIIGDGTNRISNPGTIRFGHTTIVDNAVEQLGRLELPATAPIYLDGTNAAARLSFANSSGENWASGATLMIFNWNGILTGGGTTQIRFGTDASGLTAAQLSQIRFRITSNLYAAKILDTGEVVPDQQIAPQLGYSQQGNQLILNWLPGYTLQSSPNPGGPFQNVMYPQFITSSYTNDMGSAPQMFFRIVP